MDGKMKKILSTTVSGLLFAVPIGLMFFLFSKLLKTLEKIISPIADKTGIQGILGEFTLTILSVALFMLFCYILGQIIQRATFLRVMGEGVEGFAVRMIPSLSFLKSMADEKLELNMASSWKGIMLADEGTWVPAFLVEETEEWLIIFIPEAPKGDGGEVRVFPRSAVEFKLVELGTVRSALRVYGRGLIKHIQ
jgi:uncharacterized membrane protein